MRRSFWFVLLVLGPIGCGGEEAATTGAWLSDRLADLDRQQETLRFSRENVSRPIWNTERPPAIALEPQPGSAIVFELARTGAEGPTTAPEQVEVVLELDGQETVLPAMALAPWSDSPQPWYRYRADLAAAPAGDVRISIRADGVIVGAGSGWGASLPRVLQRRDGGRHPNVLVVALDTVRADYLGCYGHDRPTSPHLDALADEGILFERPVSQASWTLPSYASVFTGLYSETHGVIHRDHAFQGPLVSFVELFADAGYATAGLVSGTFTDAYWGFDQGFDLYDDLGMITDDGGARVADPTDPQAMLGSHERVTSAEITDRAIRWLEENRERRFLLLAHYFDPHEDYVEHEGFSERFPERPVVSRMNLHQGGVDPDRDRFSALYEGELAFTDHHVGRLLAALEDLGLAEDTLVVVCSDHGEEFAERIKVGHGHGLFNELVYVPLIFRVPGLAGGTRVTTPVGNVDIAPTLLELCGIEGQIQAQGVSLVPLLRDPERTRGRPVLSAAFRSAPPEGRGPVQMAFRVDRDDEVLIQQVPPGPEVWFLFDWSDDSIQSRNLVGIRESVALELQSAYRGIRPLLDRRRLQSSRTVDLDAETREKLEALGYVQDEKD